MKLNIGCGNKVLPGWVNFDLVGREDWVANKATEGRVFFLDIREQWLGLPDNCADEVLLDNVLEHLHPGEEFINAINECYRVCKAGARVVIIVPYFFSQGAVQDPTHSMFFVPRSGLYWSQSLTPWPKIYGIAADFELVSGYPSSSENYPAFKVYGDLKTEAFIEFNLNAKK